jgi:folate-dependent phosphoribosylglycinamide formyltransferase PurN
MLMVVCDQCREKGDYGPVIGFTHFFSFQTHKTEEVELRIKIDGHDLCPKCVQQLVKDMKWK